MHARGASSTTLAHNAPRQRQWHDTSLSSASAWLARLGWVVWLVAVLAAAVLLAINERGHQRSTQALAKLDERAAAGTQIQAVLRHVLDVETSHRGYLLTGRGVYLEPATQAAMDMVAALDGLQRFYSGDVQGLALLAAVRSNALARLRELQTMQQAFDVGQSQQLAGLLADDDGRRLATTRTLVTALAAGQSNQVAAEGQAVLGTLRTSRFGVDLFAGLGLLALGLMLLRLRTLDTLQQRHAQDLNDERLRLQAQLPVRTADLRELASHLQTVREDESSRLALELHDVLGALLSATQTDIQALQRTVAGATPEVLARLDHLAETIASGISLKQRIVDNLRPVSLSTLGLVPALELLAKDFAERAGVLVQTDLHVLALSEAAQLTIFRLVQEALTNVAKHAQAHLVQVTLIAQGLQACVSVNDDGLGFEPSAPRRSAHGLLGMHARVHAAGGTLDIGAAPGKGCSVTACLPLLTRAVAP